MLGEPQNFVSNVLTIKLMIRTSKVLKVACRNAAIKSCYEQCLMTTLIQMILSGEKFAKEKHFKH